MRIRIKILTDFRWYLLSYSSRGSLSTALRIRPSVNQQDSVDSRLLVLKKTEKQKKNNLMSQMSNVSHFRYRLYFSQYFQ